MTDVTIDVRADDAAPHGTAVIRLNGLWLLPASATYVIEPHEGDLDEAEPGAWPRGEQKPREMRVTSEGVELVVGPEVTRSTGLKPDTLVDISIPQAAIRASVRWPLLHVNGMAPVASEAERPKLDEPPVPTEDADRPLAVRNAETAVEMSLAKLAAALAVEPPAAGPEPPPSTSASAPVPAGLDAAQMPLDLAIASVREATVKEASLQAARSDLLSLDKPVRRDQPTALPLELPVPRPASLQALARTTPAPQRVSGAHSVLPFAAGLFTAAFLTMAVWAFTPPAGPANQPARAVAGHQAVPSAEAPRFDEFFAVGQVSPRGVAVEGVSTAQSFELADRHMQSGAPGDRQEAEFWLKHGVVMTLAGGTNRWALTQLGTLLVDQGSRAPDYDRARLLWELAASQGDPVAMCFLGMLYEQGLGVPANKRTALGYFGRSKASGGCRGVDAAIARLKE